MVTREPCPTCGMLEYGIDHICLDRTGLFRAVFGEEGERLMEKIDREVDQIVERALKPTLLISAPRQNGATPRMVWTDSDEGHPPHPRGFTAWWHRVVLRHRQTHYPAITHRGGMSGRLAHWRCWPCGMGWTR